MLARMLCAWKSGSRTGIARGLWCSLLRKERRCRCLEKPGESPGLVGSPRRRAPRPRNRAPARSPLGRHLRLARWTRRRSPPSRQSLGSLQQRRKQGCGCRGGPRRVSSTTSRSSGHDVDVLVTCFSQTWSWKNDRPRSRNDRAVRSGSSPTHVRGRPGPSAPHRSAFRETKRQRATDGPNRGILPSGAAQRLRLKCRPITPDARRTESRGGTPATARRRHRKTLAADSPIAPPAARCRRRARPLNSVRVHLAQKGMARHPLASADCSTPLRAHRNRRASSLASALRRRRRGATVNLHAPELSATEK